MYLLGLCDVSTREGEEEGLLDEVDISLGTADFSAPAQAVNIRVTAVRVSASE